MKLPVNNTVLKSKDVDYSKYPDMKNCIETVRYFMYLSDNPIKGHSKYNLKITSNNKEKLIIIGDNEDLLSDLFDHFPFAYYNLISWITSKTIYSKNDETLETILNLTDKIVVINHDFFTELQKEIHIDLTSKVISYELIWSKFGRLYSFNFGVKNKTKTFYVIRPRLRNGLIWNAKKMLNLRSLIDVTNSFGFIDMQYFFNQHIAPRYLGKYNSWEYYFKQISKHPLEDIYHSQNVIILPAERITGVTNIFREDLSKSFSQYEESVYQDIFKGNSDVLGIFLRGTDFLIAEYHPIPFDPYETICVAEQYMSYYNLSRVFINTEDKFNFDVFKKHFGDKLLYIERNRFEHNMPLPQESGQLDNYEGLDAGANYLLESLLTSRCFGVISGPGSSGSVIENFGKHINKFFDYILIKGTGSISGKDPIIVESHNKNRLDTNNINYTSDVFDINSTEGLINITFHRDVKKITYEKKLDVFIHGNTNHYLSVDSDKASLKIQLELYDSNDNFIKTVEEGLISTHIPAYYAKLICINNGAYPVTYTFSIQLEKSLFPTPHTPYHFSETILAIKDTNEIMYKTSHVNSIDVDNGYMIVDGHKLSMSSAELVKINNVPQYNNGFILYRVSGKRYINLSHLNEINKEVQEDPYDTSILDAPYTYVKARPFLLQELTKYINSSDKRLNWIAYQKCLSLPKDKDILYMLYRIYSEGRGIPKDIDKSLIWLEKCVKIDPSKTNKLADILWGLNNEDADKRLFNLLNDHLDNIGSSIRMARLYESGRGTAKDLVHAADFVRPYATSSDWARLVYFDILYETNSKESNAELQSLIPLMENSNEIKDLQRAAKYYLNDVTVNANKEKVVRICDKIIDSSSSFKTIIEIFDMLWDYECFDSYMRNIITPLANIGDTDALLRLSNMFRLGRGMDIDFDKAIELLSMISTKNDVANKLYNAYRDQYNKHDDVVIYTTDHYAAISFMILLRLTIHKNQKAALIAVTSKYPQVYEKLLQTGIFDYVIPVCDTTVRHMRNKDQIIRFLNEYYDKSLQQNGIEIKNNTEIYSNGDIYNTFGIYLGSKKIPYHFVEACDNQSKREWYSLTYDKGWVSKEYYELQKQFRVLTSPNDSYMNLIVKITKPKQFEIGLHYDYNLLCDKIPASQKNKILSIFDVKKIHSNVINLVLFNSTSLLISNSDLKMEELPFVYQIIIDLFLNGKKAYIKPHPTSTDLLISPEKYSGYNILPPQFPMELFSMLSKRIDLAVGLKTSSMDNNKHIIKNSIALGLGFLKILDHIFTLTFIKKLFANNQILLLEQSLTEETNSLSCLFDSANSITYNKKVNYINIHSILGNCSFSQDEGPYSFSFNVEKTHDEVCKKYGNYEVFVDADPKLIALFEKANFTLSFPLAGYNIHTTFKKNSN